MFTVPLFLVFLSDMYVTSVILPSEGLEYLNVGGVQVATIVTSFPSYGMVIIETDASCLYQLKSDPERPCRCVTAGFNGSLLLFDIVTIDWILLIGSS
jgi:hypothetical protein